MTNKDLHKLINEEIDKVMSEPVAGDIIKYVTGGIGGKHNKMYGIVLSKDDNSLSVMTDKGIQIWPANTEIEVLEGGRDAVVDFMRENFPSKEIE